MVAILLPISPVAFQPRMFSTPRSPDPCSVQHVATKALQTKALVVERVGGDVFRTFRLQPTTDCFYILRSRPSTRIRLLRHEQERLQSEAGFLQALRDRSDLLIPRIIEYNVDPTPIGSSYLISGPYRGAILADIESSLSPEALGNIDKSLGRYVRQLARVQGPAFGNVWQTNTASPSWSQHFDLILESVLRDAEDALISLPYDFVRDQARRHRQSLDQISRPQLVLLEMCSDRNIVVDTTSCTISGILDLSTAVWGDPFLSDCFYQPSVSFVEGFGKLPNCTIEERIRQYLYVLYHSLLAIVRQCYRPSDSRDEMAARRNLTSSLAALTQLSSMTSGVQD